MRAAVLRIGVSLVIIGAAVVVPACSKGSMGDKQPAADSSAQMPRRMESKSIHNLYQVTPRIYSGSQPDDPDAFAQLKRLGVHTIISVDGSPPDVAAAHAAGLQYVHVPVGYDGIDHEAAVRLVKAMRTSTGPVFVHCHHGLHRGPAGAAVCAMSDAGWTNAQSVAWLHLAGTSTDYPGLYATARDFRQPTKAELAAVPDKLPEVVEPPSRVKVMVAVDKRWDHLKAAQKAEFARAADQPDADPALEAVQLKELFAELGRDDRSGRPFLDEVAKAREASEQLERALKALGSSRDATNIAAAQQAYAAVGASCKSCHTAFRN